MDSDGGAPFIFPMVPFISRGFGFHWFSLFNSSVDNKFYHSKDFHVCGSLAFREPFSCISRFAGAFLCWCSSVSNANLSRAISGSQGNRKPGSLKSLMQMKPIASCRDSLLGLQFFSLSKGKFPTPLVFDKIFDFMLKHLAREAEMLQSFSILSLAAALVPPLDHLSSKVLAIPMENAEVQMQECMNQKPCEVGRQGARGLSFLDLDWTQHTVEPRTGIEFPTILDNTFDGQHNSSLASGVLVGTGSRTVKIVRIKSLKDFIIDVHPYSVCEKLGSKYTSIPVAELNKCDEFYHDLLREDIGMTVRLVVNCNGMKVSAVKDAFEKSLRNRLLKANPNTDYHCLEKFGSFFKKDIPLPMGTIVDFRRTTDGQLITEIGGNQIGVVHSKDLCRAFFDMYIGDLPISEQTKEEIGRNVATVIRRC